jgi:hypothetical protein
MSFLKAGGLFPFLSPEHHNYPNYYHHRNPRSPYDIDRSPVWYVQKLCHHYCEPTNHPPRFALSLHGVQAGENCLIYRSILTRKVALFSMTTSGFDIGNNGKTRENRTKPTAIL